MLLFFMCCCRYLLCFLTVNPGISGFCERRKAPQGPHPAAAGTSAAWCLPLLVGSGAFGCFWGELLWICFGCISSLDLRTHEKRGMKEESVNKRRLKPQENSAKSSTSACQEEIRKENFGRKQTQFHIFSFHFISHCQIVYCSYLLDTNMMPNYILRLQFDWLSQFYCLILIL